MAKVFDERVRQEELKDLGKFLWTCADNEITIVTDGGSSMSRLVTDAEKLVVLGEEFGEVAKEVMENIIGLDMQESAANANAGKLKLRKELIQVAAVCVAWVESIDLVVK